MCPTRLGGVDWVQQIRHSRIHPMKLSDEFRVVSADGEDCLVRPLPAPTGLWVTGGGGVAEFIMKSIAMACWTAGVKFSADVVCSSVFFQRITQQNGQCALSMLELHNSMKRVASEILFSAFVCLCLFNGRDVTLESLD